MGNECESLDKIAPSEDGDVFSCPYCGAPLWRLVDGELELFRCKLGHAFSPENLTVEQRKVVAIALRTALRASFERFQLARKMAERARSRSHPSTSYLEEQYQEAKEYLENLKRAIAVLLPGEMPKAAPPKGGS